MGRHGNRLITMALLLVGGWHCQDSSPLTGRGDRQPVSISANDNDNAMDSSWPYPAPRLMHVEPRRNVRRVSALLRWVPVPGATSYRVQLSRTVTFSRLLVDRDVTRPRLALPSLKRRVFFWRVRARGPAGDGQFCTARILDASSARRKRRQLVATGVQDAPEPDATAAAPPGKLVVHWQQPPHRSLVTTRTITVSGTVTHGATVYCGGQRALITDGTFALTLPLRPGRNRLRVEVGLAGQRHRAQRDVYYVQPERLRSIKARFQVLSRQLGELDALGRELSATVSDLEGQIASSADATEAGELRLELRDISVSHQELQHEVQRLLVVIDRLVQ